MDKDTLTLAVDTPDNRLAIAVARNSSDPDGQDFIETNRIFETVFQGVRSEHQLLNLITTRSENKTLLQFNDCPWELLEVKINRTDTLYLLKNISFEMLALKRLKDQLKELTEFQELYSAILDKELPVGVLIIDDDYNVIFGNRTLKRLFNLPTRLKLSKCYNYVKEIKPCSDCILESIRTGKRNKKTFTTEDNRMVTAEVHPMKKKFIITFRDTTKEISLIHQIKQQQEDLEAANRRVERQNDILKRLSNISIRIGQLRDMDTVLETVIADVTQTFDCIKGAILLFDKEERGKIKNACFSKNIGNREQKTILKSIKARGDSADGELGRYVTQDMSDHSKLVGRVFLYQPRQHIDPYVLELFLRQIIVYLSNLELQRKLEAVAQTDSLTGVFNRYYFDKRLKEEIELSQRFGQPLSLILIDINGLKQLNDSIGHEAGDKLLNETARLLNRNTSSFDSIYRIGGDEFVILYSNCPENELDVMIEMLKEVQNTASLQHNGKTFPLRFSVGGECSSRVAHSRLKDEADKQMYVHKAEYYKNREKYR